MSKPLSPTECPIFKFIHSFVNLRSRLENASPLSSNNNNQNYSIPDNNQQKILIEVNQPYSSSSYFGIHFTTWFLGAGLMMNAVMLAYLISSRTDSSDILLKTTTNNIEEQLTHLDEVISSQNLIIADNLDQKIDAALQGIAGTYTYYTILYYLTILPLHNRYFYLSHYIVYIDLSSNIIRLEEKLDVIHPSPAIDFKQFSKETGMSIKRTAELVFANF